MLSFRSSHQSCFVKIVFLNANFTGKQLCWSLFLIWLQVFRSAVLLKIDSKTPTQVFSSEICEIFKNTYSEEYLQTTASLVFFSWSWGAGGKGGTYFYKNRKIKNKDPWKKKKILFQLIHSRKS